MNLSLLLPIRIFLPPVLGLRAFRQTMGQEAAADRLPADPRVKPLLANALGVIRVLIRRRGLFHGRRPGPFPAVRRSVARWGIPSRIMRMPPSRVMLLLLSPRMTQLVLLLSRGTTGRTTRHPPRGLPLIPMGWWGRSSPSFILVMRSPVLMRWGLSWFPRISVGVFSELLRQATSRRRRSSFHMIQVMAKGLSLRRRGRAIGRRGLPSRPPRRWGWGIRPRIAIGLRWRRSPPDGWCLKRRWTGLLLPMIRICSSCCWWWSSKRRCFARIRPPALMMRMRRRSLSRPSHARPRLSSLLWRRWRSSSGLTR